MNTKIRNHTALDRTESRAIYSPCEKYRYLLSRTWDFDMRHLAFIMLNPSTATEEQNDPTIERCERRARSMGYGTLHILNLFAYRATNPKDMKNQDFPIGKLNDMYLKDLIKSHKFGCVDIVCGWGNHGSYVDRGQQILDVMKDEGVKPTALAWTNEGQPQHPLYVPYSSKPAGIK